MKRCIRCNYRTRTLNHITGNAEHGYVCRDDNRCLKTMKRKKIDGK